MRRLFRSAVLASAALFAVSGCAVSESADPLQSAASPSATSGSAATRAAVSEGLPEQTVCFVLVNGGTLSFSNFSPLQITEGVQAGAWPPNQGPDELTNKGQGYCIWFYADRSGSTGPAEWFKNVNGGYNPNLAQYYSAGQNATDYVMGPDELNFAFSATMTYNGVDYNIALGQGHVSDLDNWWLSIAGGNVSQYVGTEEAVTQYMVLNGNNDAFIMPCGCSLYSSSYGFLLADTPFSPSPAPG